LKKFQNILVILLGYFFLTLTLSANNLQTSTAADTSNNEKAYFAGGCFWGVEYYLEQIKGVLYVTSGYMGGSYENPKYYDVIYKETGHYESVEVVYDPSLTSYESIAKTFFEIHDPTQADGQGPDIGTQYRSVIFYGDNEEKQIAQKLIGLLKKNKLDVKTKVLPVSTFYKAEEYHQNYYDKHDKQPYCHAYTKRF
jgi:methionine-S-sulfoxide reductase